MLLKAKKGNYRKIEAEIKKLHSYKVPCIVAFEWKKSSREFADWVSENAC